MAVRARRKARSLGWLLATLLELVGGPVGPVLAEAPKTCQALPPERPPELVIQIRQRPWQPPTKELDIVEEGRPCPPLTQPWIPRPRTCRGVAAARFDALHAKLRGLKLETIAVRTIAAQPHRPGYGITVSWSKGRCEIGDYTSSAVADKDRERFIAAVNASIEAASTTK